MIVRAKLAAAEPFSYRRDPLVPPFPDDKALIVYDGVCVLCSHLMQAIARRDTAGYYRFTSAQSPLGQALSQHYGLDTETLETVLLIEQGRPWAKFDMVTRVAARLGGIYRGLQLFAILPRAAQDGCYDRLARDRYRLFGRSDVCMLPDPSWRARVIE